MTTEEAPPPTPAELARLVRILFEHHHNGRRSDPAVHVEYEQMMRKLHGLDFEPFSVAVGQLVSVLYHHARLVAEWAERPFDEVLTMLDLAGQESR